MNDDPYIPGGLGWALEVYDNFPPGLRRRIDESPFDLDPIAIFEYWMESRNVHHTLGLIEAMENHFREQFKKEQDIVLTTKTDRHYFKDREKQKEQTKELVAKFDKMIKERVYGKKNQEQPGANPDS